MRYIGPKHCLFSFQKSDHFFGATPIKKVHQGGVTGGDVPLLFGGLKWSSSPSNRREDLGPVGGWGLKWPEVQLKVPCNHRRKALNFISIDAP
jgi:hypothetical protein